MSTSTPCYYTKGVDSCFHNGCHEAHENGEDFEVWMAREGDPCVACGIATFERCDNEHCDEVVHDSCGGYCKEHHCYDSQCEVCPEWPAKVRQEVINESVTYECMRCGEDVKFSFIADNGTHMYSGADGYFVCTDFTYTDEHGEFRPEHTTKEVSE